MARLPSPRTAAVLALVLGVLGGVAAGDAAVHEDADYRFRLASPGPAWRLFDEAGARRLVPDAVAGAGSSAGVFGVVLVEQAGAMALPDLVRVLLDNMPLEDKEATPAETLRFQEREAVRWRTRGRFNGLEVRYQHLVFLSEGFAYQLVCWGLAARTEEDGSTFQPFVDAFELLPGPVKPRGVGRPPVAAQGVGWRIHEGVFQSAAYRIEVRPPEGWRLAVGDELRNMNSSAEVGLVSGSPEAYLILILERASGSDKAGFANHVRTSFAERMGAKSPEEAAAVAVDGRPVSMDRYRVPGPPPVEFLHGVFFEGDLCVQVLGWFVQGLGEGAREKLLAAVPAAIRILDAREAAEVGRALEEGPDPQNRVGPTWSLRRGTYRDFGHGFRWRKPPGWWRVHAGAEAREENELATLHLEEPSRGIFGLVLAEPLGDVEPLAFHRAVLGNVFGDPDRVGEPEPIDLGDAVGYGASGRREIAGLPFRYRVVTVLHGGTGFQILLWGTPGNVKAEARAVEEAVRGFSFHANLEPATATEDGYRDDRLGFAMAPLGEGYEFEDATAPELAPVGTILSWRRPTSQLVTLGALCALQEGQDEAWMTDLLVRMVAQRGAADLVGRPPQRSETTLGGLPAHRLHWPGPHTLDLTVARRDRTFYFLAIEQRGTPPLSIAEVKARFSVVD